MSQQRSEQPVRFPWTKAKLHFVLHRSLLKSYHGKQATSKHQPCETTCMAIHDCNLQAYELSCRICEAPVSWQAHVPLHMSWLVKSRPYCSVSARAMAEICKPTIQKQHRFSSKLQVSMVPHWNKLFNTYQIQSQPTWTKFCLLQHSLRMWELDLKTLVLTQLLLLMYTLQVRFKPLSKFQFWKELEVSCIHLVYCCYGWSQRLFGYRFYQHSCGTACRGKKQVSLTLALNLKVFEVSFQRLVYRGVK